MDNIYEIDMMIDYFSESELIKKTGISKNSWKFVILKEIIEFKKENPNFLKDDLLQSSVSLQAQAILLKL